MVVEPTADEHGIDGAEDVGSVHAGDVGTKRSAYLGTGVGKCLFDEHNNIMMVSVGGVGDPERLNVDNVRGTAAEKKQLTLPEVRGFIIRSDPCAFISKTRG